MARADRPPASKPARRMRADAQRNRERLLAATREVFSELGVDAQMSDIAERAGLGMGTVYRHFATKEALVEALLRDTLDRVLAAVSDPGPDRTSAWDRLERFLRFMTLLQIEDRSLSHFMAGRVPISADLTAQRDAVFKAFAAIVAEAKRAGALRADVEATDIRVAMIAIARAAWRDSPKTRRALDRYLGILLDGLRAPGSVPLEGTALTPDELHDTFPTMVDGGRAFVRGRRRWHTQ